MDMNNPLVWIIGFVLIFYVIGGGVFGGRAVAAEVATNNGVGNRDLLDTMFAGFQGLGNQNQSNFTNLKDQSTSEYFGLTGQLNSLSDKIERNRYDDLLLRYQEQGMALQTATIMAELCKKVNIPSFNVDGCFSNCG